MALYFFDLVDSNTSHRDDTGTEFVTIEAVREAARRVLPDIARDETPAGGDQSFFTVIARDTEGQAVYTATLTLSGTCLDQRS